MQVEGLQTCQNIVQLRIRSSMGVYLLDSSQLSKQGLPLVSGFVERLTGHERRLCIETPWGRLLGLQSLLSTGERVTILLVKED